MNDIAVPGRASVESVLLVTQINELPWHSDAKELLGHLRDLSVVYTA